MNREQIEEIGYEFGLLIRSRTELVSGNQIEESQHRNFLDIGGVSVYSSLVNPIRPEGYETERNEPKHNDFHSLATGSGTCPKGL